MKMRKYDDKKNKRNKNMDMLKKQYRKFHWNNYEKKTYIIILGSLIQRQ